MLFIKYLCTFPLKRGYSPPPLSPPCVDNLFAKVAKFSKKENKHIGLVGLTGPLYCDPKGLKMVSFGILPPL